VLKYALDPRREPHAPRRFERERRVPHLASGGIVRFLRIQAVALELVLRQPAMRVQFVTQVVAAEPKAQASKEFHWVAPIVYRWKKYALFDDRCQPPFSPNKPN